MKVLRSFVQEPRTVDIVVAVLSTWLVLGAYVISYAYVHESGHIIEAAEKAGFTFLTAAWALLTLYLSTAFALGLRAGRPWNRALPEGETGSFVAALIFGAAWIVDAAFWTPAFGSTGVGLDSLFTPPHLVEMGAAAVIVSGPLRAAARRGESVASPVALLSATLLLSVLSFATQFVHPLIDPWGMASYEFRSLVLKPWIGENIGVAELLAQTMILAGTGLLLNSAFKLRPGALTFVFGMNGVFVCITKLHFEMLAVPIAAGVAADAFVAWSSRRQGKPSASLCALIGGTYAFAYMADVNLHPEGSTWAASLWAGSIIACTMLCWLLGRVLRAGLPAAIVEPFGPEPAPQPVVEKWTVDPINIEERQQLVHRALEDLGTPEALARSPLIRLPGIATAADLRALLADMITDLANATPPRDAEAGRLLLEYYVRKYGSHEVISERLHLSRAVYYRRLHRGFELIALRLDDVRVPPRVPVTG